MSDERGPSEPPRERDLTDVPVFRSSLIAWTRRRRSGVAARLERDRAGGHRIPTWVLAGALVLVVAAWAALIIFG